MLSRNASGPFSEQIDRAQVILCRTTNYANVEHCPSRTPSSRRVDESTIVDDRAAPIDPQVWEGHTVVNRPGLASLG